MFSFFSPIFTHYLPLLVIIRELEVLLVAYSALASIEVDESKLLTWVFRNHTQFYLNPLAIGWGFFKLWFLFWWEQRESEVCSTWESVNMHLSVLFPLSSNFMCLFINFQNKTFFLMYVFLLMLILQQIQCGNISDCRTDRLLL